MSKPIAGTKKALRPNRPHPPFRGQHPQERDFRIPEFKDPKEPRLSLHFTENELGVQGCDARVKANARYLCEKILEPIRMQFGSPVFVTSGYRDPAHNAQVGGKGRSFHLYQDDRCAADFKVIGVAVQETFDWLRLESGLPFDKVIMEYQDGEPQIIHIQAMVKTAPRRLAYVGETGDGKQYEAAEVG
jgi:hypothetical protein